MDEQAIKLNKRYTIRPGVIFQRRGDLFYITDLAGVCQYVINETAYETLLLLNEKLTLAEVIRKLQLKYCNNNVSEEQVANDTIRLMEKLVCKDLITDKDIHKLLEEYYKPAVQLMGGMRFKPGLVYWEVTKACNYRCFMCYIEAGSPRANELSLEEGLEAIEKMKSAGVTVIIFTGGEPLSRKNKVIRWIEAASKSGIRSELFTNGSFITKETAARLKESGLGYARVSVQGGTKETHEYVTQIPGSWERTLEGLKNLIRVGIPTCMMMTTNKKNLPTLRTFIEDAIKLGCHGVRFGSLDMMGRGEDVLDLRLSPAEELMLWRFIDEAIVVYGDKIKIGFGADINSEKAWGYYVTKPVTPYPDATKDPSVYMRYAKNSLCGVGVRAFGLTADGYISPCPALAELKMGHILKDDLLRVWEEGEYFHPFRNLIVEEYESCGECGLRYICAGGCRANAYHQTGSLIGKDIRRCDAIKELQKLPLDAEVKSFFTEEELSVNLKKYEIVEGSSLKERLFYGSETEGLGPWIPYTAMLFRKYFDKYKNTLFDYLRKSSNLGTEE